MFDPNFIGHEFCVIHRDIKRDHTSYLNLAINKFNQVRQKSVFEKIKSYLFRQPVGLIELESILKNGIFTQYHGSIQPVLIKDICGTLNRQNDFDRFFNPLDDRFRDRWVSIALSKCKKIPLPPVELIKVDDCFFVKDGHHRISVARAFGEIAIDAEITVLNLSCPLQN